MLLLYSIPLLHLLCPWLPRWYCGVTNMFGTSEHSRGYIFPVLCVFVTVACPEPVESTPLLLCLLNRWSADQNRSVANFCRSVGKFLPVRKLLLLKILKHLNNFCLVLVQTTIIEIFIFSGLCLITCRF
jgi:hypothetical protein